MKIISIQEASKSFLAKFDSGEELLNIYLKQYALKNDVNGIAKTFLCVSDDKTSLIGFFSLSTANIQFDEYKNLNKESIPHYPIPCVRIARLAVDKNEQGKGVGKYLLKECFLRILLISKTIGVYLVIVDAKESSTGFYEHYGFNLLKKDSLTYFIKLSVVELAYKDSIDEK